MYVLTPLTRGAAERRRTVIKGVDLPSRPLMVGLVAAIPALLAGLVASLFVGVFGVLVFAAVDGLAVAAYTRRTRRGMHLRVYRALLDRQRSDVGRFFVSGREFRPGAGDWLTVRAGSVPSPFHPPAADVSVDDLFAGVDGR